MELQRPRALPRAPLTTPSSSAVCTPTHCAKSSHVLPDKGCSLEHDRQSAVFSNLRQARGGLPTETQACHLLVALLETLSPPQSGGSDRGRSRDLEPPFGTMLFGNPFKLMDMIPQSPSENCQHLAPANPCGCCWHSLHLQPLVRGAGSLANCEATVAAGLPNSEPISEFRHDPIDS